MQRRSQNLTIEKPTPRSMQQDAEWRSASHTPIKQQEMVIPITNGTVRLGSLALLPVNQSLKGKLQSMLNERNSRLNSKDYNKVL